MNKLEFAYQTIKQLDSRIQRLHDETATLQQELDRLKNPWVPISEYDGTSVVLRWHKIWKCPIAVYLKSPGDDLVWFERTLTTRWPDAAFEPFYMELPEPPQQ